MAAETTLYVIYRHGANSVNQPMTQAMPVGIIEALTGMDAVRLANRRWRLYANQWFDAVPAMEVSFDAVPAMEVSEDEY